jgi:hypothetical protein
MPVQRARESAQSTHAFLTSSGATLGLGPRFGRAPVADPACGSGCIGREEGKGLEADRQGRPEEAVRSDGERRHRERLGARRVGCS